MVLAQIDEDLINTESPFELRIASEVRLLLMDDNTAAADDGGICTVLGRSGLVVVHENPVVVQVHDLDAELANTGIARRSRNHESIVPGAIDGATALVLGMGSDHQPVETHALKVEPRQLKLEFGLTRRHVRPLEVFGDKAKTRLPGQSRVLRVSALRRIKPPAAGHESF